MSARTEIEKKIEKKNQDILSLENQIREARSYIAGLQDALKSIPKDPVQADNGTKKLRAGTDAAKAEQFILKAGKAMYIVKILEGIGKEVTKGNIRSLGGALNAYVRAGHVFTKTAPNTFGHISFGDSVSDEDDLPPDFGLDSPK
jgi:hypothetical protein